MDAAQIEAAQADLVTWGIVEEAPLQMTRRFRGAMMRAAASLQAQERAGERPAGHPVEVTVLAALREYPLPPGADVGRAHELFLVGLELASLPEAIRELLDAA